LTLVSIKLLVCMLAVLRIMMVNRHICFWCLSPSCRTCRASLALPAAAQVLWCTCWQQTAQSCQSSSRMRPGRMLLLARWHMWCRWA
jgi:hypothetical protein